MKRIFNKFLHPLFAIGLCAVISCENKEPGFGVSMFPESYIVSINGSHPDGAIDVDIEVKGEETINQDKVTLNANQGTLTIVINLPVAETTSGNNETIGLVVQNLDETDIWKIEDTYQTFHFSLSSQQRKRAVMDYVIEGDNLYYGSLNRFDKGTVSLTREGDQLVGNFAGKLERDGRTGLVDISGSFRASLGEDGLE